MEHFKDKIKKNWEKIRFAGSWLREGYKEGSDRRSPNLHTCDDAQLGAATAIVAVLCCSTGCSSSAINSAYKPPGSPRRWEPWLGQGTCFVHVVLWLFVYDTPVLQGADELLGRIWLQRSVALGGACALFFLYLTERLI